MSVKLHVAVLDCDVFSAHLFSVRLLNDLRKMLLTFLNNSRFRDFDYWCIQLL